MAYYAELDNQDNVLRVIAVNDNDNLDPVTQLETEEAGIAFCKSLYGEETIWLKTSYNNNIRGNYASEGYLYIREHDIFMPPKPFNSWTLDVDNAEWVAPVEYPVEPVGVYKHWNEELQQWEVQE